MHPFILIAAALVAVANARPAAECCNLLAKKYPHLVHYPDVSTYEDESAKYWSSTCELDPGCYFTPSKVPEVQTAVKLFASNNCRFSVRAGGHSSIPGAANNDKGVTIAMTNFIQRDVDPVNNVMSIGPGNRFFQVYGEADKYSKAPAIGRYGQVGTGLLLGAGLSFLNNPEGLSVDNVLAYHVVLADGRAVVASKDSHSDLFRALKGGGDNFGVVTRYDVRLFDRPQTVTGGLITYGEEGMDQIDDVTYEYHVDTAVNHHDTHVLPQWGYNGATGLREAFVPFYYAGVTSGGLPPSLKAWEEVPHVASTIRNVTKFEDLAHENNDGYPNGLAQAQRTFTIYADLDFFKELSAHYYEWSKARQHLPGFYTLSTKMPITPHMIKEGVKKGRNVLGLEGVDRTLSVVYFGLTVADNETAEKVFPEHAQFVEEMRELARKKGLLHRYIMWNYSGWDQKSLQSYGQANVAFLKLTSARYDPLQVFQRLVGGQKLP